MRRQYQYQETGTNFRVSTQLNQTPRGYRPTGPIDTSRRSTTPTKIQQRLSNSPLKTPLQSAINKAVKTRENQYSRISMNTNKVLGKSSRKDQSPMISMAKKFCQQQDPQSYQIRSHPQTCNFIKKYFESANQEIPLQRFIEKIMMQYETLWGTQNVDKIFDDFTYKIADIFGSDYVDLRELIRTTKQDGMIGLILRIFKQIKNEETIKNSNYISFSQNPQVVNISRSFEQRINQNESVLGIKNVVQQFMESMYQAMENQIYQKFNIEMRRMIIKYRQAQKLLKKVNEKINNYADVFDFDLKLREKDKKYQSAIQQLNKLKQKAILDLDKEKEYLAAQRKEKEKIIEQNFKLKQTLEKYQNIVLSKAMESQPSLLKQNSVLSRTNQKSSEPTMRTSQVSPPEPFKITIDTHVVHKQNVPETKTVTTFHPVIPSPSIISQAPPLQPIVQRQSYQSRNIHFKASTSPFSTSRVTTYRPISPSPLSPYQSRIIRPN